MIPFVFATIRVFAMKKSISLFLLLFAWFSIILSGCTLLGTDSSTQKSIEEQGVRTKAEQFYKDGLKFYQGKFFIQAAQSFRQAAELGHAEAQFRLARMYYDSEGVLQRDSAQAAQWYQKAAEQGHAAAQYFLGALYFVGSGVPQDFTMAEKWYLKAATQNQTDAQLSLGMMYFKGTGVSQDLSEAKKWLSLAVEHGNKDAATALEELNSKLANPEG